MTTARASRRAVLGLVGLGLACPARAQNSIGLRLVVGAPRGTGADRWARGFAPFLERHWPHSNVTISNQPGEGGLTAARALATATPDGRSFGLVATPALIARAIERGATEMLDSVTFVAAVTEETLVLVAPPGTDLATLRARAGGLIGCPPPGSTGHLLAGELSAPLPLNLLAFPNATSARQAVLAGNLAAALLLLPDVLTALREDRLVALATGGVARSRILPDVPGFAELNLPTPLPTWRGFILPRGTPAEMSGKLQRSLLAAVGDPEFAEQAAAAGFEPRFIPGHAWNEQLSHLRRRLTRRWENAPWIARRD